MSKFKHLLFFLVFSFNLSNTFGQLVSVPFDDGFIGSIGNNSQDARSITKFSTLGISKSAFIQQTNDGQFYETQGNDIGGKLRLYFTTSKSVTVSNVTTTKNYIDIDGAIVWRGPGGGVGDYYGFLPNPNTNISFIYGSSSTFTITRSSNGSTGSNIGNLRVDKTGNFTDGTNESGNAAGVLTDLNSYRTSVQSLDPNGPVTVVSQTTTNQTPTITGTATLINGESLSVTVNGTVYSVGDGNLTINGTTWTLVIPNTISTGTYSVEAIITNSGGYTLTDGTSNELVILVPSITTTGTLKTFPTCSGCTVTPQSFTLSGSDLIADIVVTAPTGVEVSTNQNSGYQSSVTINQISNTVSTTTVYVKLTNNATAVSSGALSITSTGATTKTISVTTNTDNALNFDGTSDYVQVPDNNLFDFGTGSFTVEMWVKPTTTTGRMDLISKKNNSSPYEELGLFINNSNDGKLTLWTSQNSGGSSNESYLVSNSPLVVNKWNHIAVVRNGTTHQIYLNGVLDASATLSARNIASAGDLFIGKNNTSFYFSGSLDEIRFWNVARSGTQIQQNINADLNGTETNLVAYYDFNNGIPNNNNSGLTTVDNQTSDNTIHATLNSFALNGTSSNYVPGFIPNITTSGNVTTVPSGNTLQLTNGLLGGVWSTTNSSVATVDANTGIVTGVSAGAVSITYSICDKTVSYGLTVTIPTVSISGTLKTFTTCSGCSVAAQSFTISGSNLGSNVTVTAPTGFEVSNALNGTYSSTLSLAISSGSLTSTSVFVKLINNAITATGGNFTVSSTGATSQTIAATVNTDNALDFDGVDDLVILDNVGNNTNFSFTGTNSFTLEAWINRAVNSNTAEIISKNNGSVSSNYRLFISADGKPVFAREADPWSVIGSNVIPFNEWHHVVGVFDGTSMKLYVDGIQTASTPASQSVTSNVSAVKVYIGATLNNSQPLNLFKGKIDEVRIWNIARSSSDIQNSYLTELAGNETGLVAYYNFNQGVINGTNSINDLILNKTSVANIDATLQGFAMSGSGSNFIPGIIPNITASGNASTLRVANTLQLTNALIGGTWSSSNSSIATVNASGLVTGVSVGTISVSYTICQKTVSYNLTILPQAPISLSYTTPNVYTTGSSITALNPISTGGAITSYSVNPTLPAGLTIDPTTGIISGTPTTTSSQTTYIVTGTNLSGTVTATVVITVNGSAVAPVVQSQTEYCVQEQVGEYKYIKVVFSNTKNLSSANSIQVAEWKWFNGNAEISRSNVTVTNPSGSNPGGEEPSKIYDGSTSSKWLDFNIKTGNNTSTLLFTYPGTGVRITGYSWVTANDSEERDPKSWNVYMSNDNVNWTQVHTVSNYNAPSSRNAASTAWTIANTTAEVTLSATTTSGYTLRWYTSASGGTATTTAPKLNTSSASSVTYYVSQINQAGYETPRSTLTVNVNALPAAPIVSGVNYTIGTAASALSATALSSHNLQWYTTSSGGTASSTAPTPSTASLGTVNYYVSQVNAVTGCEGPRATLSVVTSLAAPAGLSYTTPNVYTTGTSISALNPSSTGGAIASYTVSPVLPAGLTLNTNTGIISGIPSAASSQTSYVVTGTNATGTITATVVITVNESAPAGLSYTTPNVYTTGTSISALNPSSTGGAIASYTVSPVLPAGLTLNTNTGVISGTPSAASAQTSYVVTGTNATGTVTATVVITVNSGVLPQPQGGINAVDYNLLATDSVKLKIAITNGTAPFTLILNNSYTNIKDTLTNLTPINNEVIFKLKKLDSTKTFTIFKLIDANNNIRIAGFTKDTTRVNVLKPKIVLTLKAEPTIKQVNNSFKTKLLLKIKNVGDLDLRNVQVNANLSTVFPQGINYILDSVRVLSGNFSINPNYTGAGTATAASSIQKITTTINKGNKNSYATLDQNYLFNNGVSLNKNEEGEVVYYVSIGATTQNVTLKLQFESAGAGVLPKSDGTSSIQETKSKSDDGTNISQHPDITNEGLPLPTYVPLIPNEKIGASLNVSESKPVTGGYEFHFVAKVKNYGNVNLDSIRIEYDLNKMFPTPDQAVLVSNPTITRGNIIYNATNYNGNTNINLFNYGGNLQVGDSATYEYDLKVTTTKISYTWPNYFIVYARSINSGIVINDTSMAGLNPDPNNDNDPIEKFYTNATINYSPPAPPVVENKTYVFGSSIPTTIGGLVKSTPTGTVPVWCNEKTAACSLIPPSTPTAIGKYIFALRSYDTATLLYSDAIVYDTIIVKPPLPIVQNKKYIIGVSTNPANISSQVIGLEGSSLKYFKNAALQSTVPVLGSTVGIIRYTASQIVKEIESDTVGFTVEMLDSKNLLHVQKITSEPTLLSNSTFNIVYTFIVTNRTKDVLTNIAVSDNLLNTFPSPTNFDVITVSSSGGLIANNSFNGKTDIQLLKATSQLIANAVDTIKLTLNLQPKGYNGVVNNIATINATSPNGTFSLNSSSTSFANETAKTPTPLTIPDLKIDIPEAFSPNRDGVNDRFVIVKPYGATLELEIFNRWGNVVYYNSNYNNDWDGRGTNNFIGQDLLDGGYYYALKVKFANGSVQNFKGFVIIQR